MNSNDDFTSQILQSLTALAAEQESCALNDVISRAIKTMTIYRILEIRCAIADAFDQDAPVVAAALNLIDGQIALREIARDQAWR